jgi:ornithine cyclodeaminase
MLIVGAGVQARAHLEAFAQVVGLERLYVTSRTLAAAQALAARARELGIDASCVANADEALGEARIVVTATTASAALFGDAVRDDAFVAAVGAYRPEMCELPAGLIRRAAVFVDDLAGAHHEAGDILQAGLDWSLVTGLERVVAGEVAAPSHGPVVFKSVGQALWDLAAARLAFEAQATGETGGTR